MAGLDDASMEAWVTPTRDSYNWNYVVRFAGRQAGFYYCFRSLTTHRAELINNEAHNERIQRKDVPVQPGQRIHVVVTYDQDGHEGDPLLCAYVNGKPTGRMGTSIRLSELKLHRGQIGPFAGRFDELRIYDYPLSDAEARASYGAGPDKLIIAD